MGLDYMDGIGLQYGEAWNWIACCIGLQYGEAWDWITWMGLDYNTLKHGIWITIW
jgi:hypothetical protein